MEPSRCRDNVPDVPFARYGHRPLDVRDVMVFRIMSEYLDSGRVSPRVFRQPLQLGNPFGLIKSQDRQLGVDLQLVRKMLFTSRTDERHHKLALRLQIPPKNISWPPVRNMTQGDEVVDLVQRYYLEDGSGFRHWLDATRPALNTLHGAKSIPDEACINMFRSQLKMEGKKWAPKDLHNLSTLQRKVDLVGNDLRLYDGGAFLPLLRQSLDRGFRDPTIRQRYVGAARKNVIPLWPGLEGLTEANLWLRPCWENRASFKDALQINEALGLDARAPCRGRAGQRGVGCRRSSSQPDERAFGAADIPKRRRFDRYTPSIGEQQLEIAYPKMTLMELYRKSRSRSVSPSRFADMLFNADNHVEQLDSVANNKEIISSSLPFERRTAPPARRMCGLQAKVPTPRKNIVPKNAFMHHVTEEYCPNCQEYHPTPERDSEWVRLQRFLQPDRSSTPHSSSCQNCADPSHPTLNCLARCGFCGAPNPHRTAWDQSTAPPGFHGNPHMAPQCPVAKSNRCKCVTFPQFHVADKCAVVCSRKCGNPCVLGSSKHKNAMTCKGRCCMCGVKGHSGKECRLKTCRCKGKHLGQDCGWNPACRIPGCGRYLCGLHCRECGSTEKPFVGWKCQSCLPGIRTGTMMLTSAKTQKRVEGALK